MWRELVEALDPTAQYATGASEIQFVALRNVLGIALPEDLRALLSESNGIRDQYGFCLVWSVEEILRYNQEMRTLHQYTDRASFTDSLFFADAGNGDRFAFHLHEGEVRQNSIFVWDHEENTWREIASSLRSYLEGWLSGELSV
ncbi:MAG TPA: SMI1/KNR4 family protein [Ktedonobacteraceae bacterium]|nr:SMI1/KNR4 family protein [Ktedonobacteraceae bacterium]